MGKPSECVVNGDSKSATRKFSVPASFLGGGERDVQSFVSNFLATHPCFAREWFREHATTDMVQAWLADRGLAAALRDKALSAAYADVTRCGRNSVTSELFQDIVSGGPKHRKKSSCHERITREVHLKQMDEHEMLMELIRDIANELDIDTLCHKILVNVSMLTNSDRGSLFLARGSRGNRFLVAKLFDVTPGSVLEDALCAAEIPPIPFGVGIAGHVAQTKDAVIIKDAYQDPRFNKEIDVRTGYRTVSMMCMPILNFKGDVIGVAQCINKVTGDHEFTKQDEEVFRKYLTFCGIGIQNAQLFEMSLQEFKRNQLLLSLAQSIFEESSSLENLINKIMTKAEDLLQCDKCKVYLVDIEHNAVTYQELEDEKAMKMPATGIPRKFSRPEDVVFTTVFELCQGEDMIHHSDMNTCIGIDALYADFARQVAATGQTLNWSELPDQHVYNGLAEPQLENGVRSGNSALSIPIFNSEQKVIGVAQLVNKPKGEPFTEADVVLFEAFSIFCGLGIHNTQMYESAMRLMAKQRVALEVLSYHASSSVEETKKLMNASIPSAEHFNLYNFDFSDFKLTDDDTCQAALRMFMELELISRFHIPYQVVCRWILSVKKNYRPVIYHNWRHALNVAQTMFAMLSTGQMCHLMTSLESLALLVACLCHDLDHRGTNNSFQTKIDSPLAILYSTSTMEHHHFDQCIMILHSEGNNIFQSLSPEEYREAIRVIESAILSTDLALYFQKKDKFFRLVESGGINWQEPNNKDLLRGMMMTACDVSAICKPWEVQRKIAEMVASEFFQQGDLERERLNEQPIAMMDRDKKDELPKMQVGFIDVICIPVYRALSALQPSLLPLLQGCQQNRRNWQNLVNDYVYDKVAPSSAAVQDNPTAARVRRTGVSSRMKQQPAEAEGDLQQQRIAEGSGKGPSALPHLQVLAIRGHRSRGAGHDCASRYRCGNPVCSLL